MADFAPINTHRYRVRYQVLGAQHVMTFRYGRGTYDPDAPEGVVEDFLSALMPILHSSFTILGADSAAADSELFFPSSPPVGIGTGGVTDGDEAWRPLFGSFVGRSLGGSRCVVFVYGVMTNPLSGSSSAENDYRLVSAENPAVAGAVGVLNSLAAPFTGIDGTEARWYSYMNIGLNGYYQRKRRRG